MSGHRLCIQIRDDHVLFKGLASRGHFPRLIKNQAVSIEHQFILSSNHVRIGQDDAVFTGAGRQHLFTVAALSHMERRCIDIDDDFRPGVRLQAGRTLR